MGAQTHLLRSSGWERNNTRLGSSPGMGSPSGRAPRIFALGSTVIPPPPACQLRPWSKAEFGMCQHGVNIPPRSWSGAVFGIWAGFGVRNTRMVALHFFFFFGKCFQRSEVFPVKSRECSRSWERHSRDHRDIPEHGTPPSADKPGGKRRNVGTFPGSPFCLPRLSFLGWSLVFPGDGQTPAWDEKLGMNSLFSFFQVDFPFPINLYINP